MTSPRDPDRLVQAFLDEGPAVLPDRVLDAVRDDIHQTDQRVVFGPWRTFTMPRVFATAAVIATVALGGIAYMATRPVPPDLGSTPSPSALASPVMPAFHNNGAIVVIDGGLRAINPTSGNATKGIQLPDAPAVDDGSEATWSPDGTQLAYAAPGNLWVADVSTGDSRTVASCGRERTACTLAWSPDGSRIAVARGGSLLELIDPETGEVATLETPAGTMQPTWSPDGTRIAFRADAGIRSGLQQTGLYVINRDGSDLTLLLDRPIGFIDPWDPSWSPDGSTIAYIASTATEADDWLLHVMLLELNGSEPRELVEAGTCFCLGFSPGLTWSPDGASLALVVPGGGDYGLHIVNADGTNFHRVRDAAGSPAWQPVP